MYQRKVFTVRLGHVKPADRTDAIDDLAWHLHNEFPAYWVSSWVKGDEVAALVIATDAPGAQFQKLNGWGNSRMTLAEVVE